MKRYALVLTVLLAQLVMGEDFFWKPNNNWNNPSNWKLDRVPCGGDIASFTSVPDGTTIYLNEDIAVQTILLPDNGEIILKPAVAINLREESVCSDGIGPEDQPPTGGGINEYIGAAPSRWECSENWLNENNFPADHSPCGDDRAFFNQGFSSVSAKQAILVSYLEVRGTSIQSMDELDKAEFPLDITINPDCKANPSLCPCPPDTDCKDSSPIVNPQTTGGQVVGIVLGILLAAIVIIVIIILLITVIVVMYRKQRQVVSYSNDLLEEPAISKNSDEDQILKEVQSSPISRTFSNPIYDETVVPSSDIPVVNYESKPKLDFNVPFSTDSPPKYDPVDYDPDANDDDHFVKVDLSTFGDLDVPTAKEESYESSDDQNGNKQEKTKHKGKKISGVSKYERFD